MPGGEGVNHAVEGFGAFAGDALETADRLAAPVSDHGAFACQLLKPYRGQIGREPDGIGPGKAGE